MISSAIAMLLMASAPQASQDTRGDYSRCLKDFRKTSLDRKLDAVAVDTAFASACQDKEAVFRAAQIKSGVALGMKRAESEKATSEEIAEYRSLAKEEYRAELASAPN